MPEKLICCICGAEMDETQSNNPWPVREYSEIGSQTNCCCQLCNDTIVLPYRIVLLGANQETTECIANKLSKLDKASLLTILHDKQK